MKAVPIKEFEGSALPLLDVRSPGEFRLSHMIGAFNVPLLSDQHREQVGKCYKQKGQDAAIALGYQLVDPLRPAFLEQVKSIVPEGKLRLYCARGGLRSHKMAEFLEASGYEVMLLKSGYKSYRHHVLGTIRSFSRIIMLSGNTGSGKTEVLHELRLLGCQVLDLEALANHKGSAFGALGNEVQPGSAQFHNLIFEELKHYAPGQPLWVENENVTIGKVYIPEELWHHMQAARGYEIEIPVEERVRYIVEQYGKFEAGELISCIKSLSRRLGDEACRELCELTAEGELEKVVKRLFQYYDKAYVAGRVKRNCQEFVKIPFGKLDPAYIARFLLSENIKNPIYNP